MKTTIALALALAFAVTPVQAKHHRHHHKHGSSMTSGPGLEAGAPDASRPGGKGISKKPSE